MARGSFFERLPKEKDGADLGTKSRLDTSKMFEDVAKTIKRFRMILKTTSVPLKNLTSCDSSNCSQVPEACHAKRGSLDLKLMKHQDSRNFLEFLQKGQHLELLSTEKQYFQIGSLTMSASPVESPTRKLCAPVDVEGLPQSRPPLNHWVLVSATS